MIFIEACSASSNVQPAYLLALQACISSLSRGCVCQVHCSGSPLIRSSRFSVMYIWQRASYSATAPAFAWSRHLVQSAAETFWRQRPQPSCSSAPWVRPRRLCCIQRLCIYTMLMHIQGSRSVRSTNVFQGLYPLTRVGRRGSLPSVRRPPPLARLLL